MELKVKQTNLLLLLVVILFATIGLLAQHLSLNAGLIITEWGVIFLPTFIFARKKFSNVKSALRLNPISAKSAFIALFIGIIGWALATVTEGVITYFFMKNGAKEPPQPFGPPVNVKEFMELLLIVSISAGICEEFLYRGLILRGYEEFGTKRAIFFSGFLFALMHASLLKFFPILILGILFSYMAVQFNSIYPTMIAHATNNAISVIILALLPHPESASQSTSMLLGAAMTILVIVAFITLPFLLHYIKKNSVAHYVPAPYSIGQMVIKLMKMWPFILIILILLLLTSLEVFYLTGLLDKLSFIRIQKG